FTKNPSYLHKEIMNRNLIFAFILLATLFMVNAVPHQLFKRGTTFNPCPLTGVDPLTVSINPDPPVAGKPEKFKVGGTLAKGITAGKTVLAIGFTDVNKAPLIDPFVQPFAKSIAPKTPFKVKAGKVP